MSVRICKYAGILAHKCLHDLREQLPADADIRLDWGRSGRTAPDAGYRDQPTYSRAYSPTCLRQYSSVSRNVCSNGI